MGSVGRSVRFLAQVFTLFPPFLDRLKGRGCVADHERRREQGGGWGPAWGRHSQIFFAKNYEKSAGKCVNV